MEITMEDKIVKENGIGSKTSTENITNMVDHNERVTRSLRRRFFSWTHFLYRIADRGYLPLS